MIIVIVVALLLVGLLGVAATKPDTLHVERSTPIAASPEKIFPFIKDFHRWKSWSPYERKDPAMKRRFGSITIGEGARYEWDGDRNVGQGSMEITASATPSRVDIKLDLVRPMEGHNTVIFALRPAGDRTQVSWAMDAPMPFDGKRMFWGGFKTLVAL